MKSSHGEFSCYEQANNQVTNVKEEENKISQKREEKKYGRKRFDIKIWKSHTLSL